MRTARGISKPIPTPKSSLTLPSPLLVEGPECTPDHFGGSGRRRSRLSGRDGPALFGRVHPGREPLRDVASLEAGFTHRPTRVDESGLVIAAPAPLRGAVYQQGRGAVEAP